MNDDQLDKLFQSGFEKEQSFTQNKQQWKQVKKGISGVRKKFFFWIPFLLLTMITTIVAYGYLGQDGPNLEILAQESTDQSKQEISFDNDTKMNETFEANNLVESDSKASNTKASSTKASSTKINKTKVDPAEILGINTKLALTYSETTDQISKEENVYSNEIKQINSYNEAAKITLNQNPPSYSGYQNSYNSKSDNLNYAINEIDSTNRNSENNERIEVSQVPITSLVYNSLVFTEKILPFQYQTYPVYSVMHKNSVGNHISIYAGVSHSFTSNNDLVLNKPNSLKLGLIYNLLGPISIRAAYQYNPSNVQVTSNIEDYGIEPYGSYEPGQWDRTNIIGQTHVFSLGLSANKKIANWTLYPFVNANFNYLRNTVEEHAFATAYQLIIEEDQVSNQFYFSNISPGVGIQYNLNQIGISLEYEYNIPFESLYNWTGIQNINLLIHYKL